MLLHLNPDEIQNLRGISERSGQELETIVTQGKIASNFTKSYIKPGTPVKLELDVELRDRYKRLLAYVYLPNGTFFNALLVQEGYAQVMTVPPNVKYQDLFFETSKGG